MPGGATADVVQITARDTMKAFMALLRGFWIENYRSPGCRGLSKPQAPRSRGSGTERTATAKPERQGSDKAGGFAEGLARSCKRIVAGRDGPDRQPGSDSARSSGPGAGSIVEGARGNHSPGVGSGAGRSLAPKGVIYDL